MNCYYSNLIEGHETHPIEIERAPSQTTTAETRRNGDLQLEAKAHIAVQCWIDNGGPYGGGALKVEGIRKIHQRFFAICYLRICFG